MGLPERGGYSYQNQITLRPIRLNEQPDLAVLADKNPLWVVTGNTARMQPALPDDTPSQAHGRPGQNVLLADGSVSWTLQPMIGTDNIWLLHGTREVAPAGNEEVDANLLP